jgi:hypothetical protein
MLKHLNLSQLLMERLILKLNFSPPAPAFKGPLFISFWAKHRVGPF